MAGTSRGRLISFERDAESKPYRMGRTFTVEGGVGSSAVVNMGTMAGAPVRSSTAGSMTPISEAAESGARPSAHGGAPSAAAASGGGASVRACSLAVSPADDGVAVLTSDGQLLQLGMASGDRRGLYSGLQHLAPRFHFGAITGLASCTRRAVVATAGIDRTIRIWNYQDKSAELVGGWAAGLMASGRAALMLCSLAGSGTGSKGCSCTSIAVCIVSIAWLCILLVPACCCEAECPHPSSAPPALLCTFMTTPLC